ncbi:MAG TPA: hypothetical protein P5534_03715 [Candidatus Paceibacterota bacterium]|nr:hypothetical protein [Candidatus Paceibacterota bacterium]
MKRSFGKLLPAAVAALVLASFAMAPYADARGGGGGGRVGGGGGGARAGGGGGVDARTNNVRSGSINSVNVNKNVNVEGGGGWDRGYRPVAGAAVVGTAVAVGAAAASTSCTTVYSEGVAVEQCQ